MLGVGAGVRTRARTRGVMGHFDWLNDDLAGVLKRPYREADMKARGLGYGLGVKDWTVAEQRARSQEENRQMLAAMKGAYENGMASTGRDENVILGAQGTGDTGGLLSGSLLAVASGDYAIYTSGDIRDNGLANRWMRLPEVAMGAEDFLEGGFTSADLETLYRFAEAAPFGPARDWLWSMVRKVSAASQPKPEPEIELPSEPIPSREVKPLDLELIKVG